MTGPLTLALDDLLCSPDLDLLAAELRATLPTSLLDQADAAARDIAHRLQPTAARFGMQARHPSPVDVPAWLRLGALHALTGWAAGHADTCRHNPNPHRPQPVAAAAWRPDLIVCGACTHLLAIPNGSPTDRTCDACGQECDDGIYPCTIVLGLLAYAFGVCGDCRPAPTSDEDHR